MDGCVPDSIRYVPGFRGNAGVPKVNAAVVPAATSVPNDCTRIPCGGGVKPAALPKMGQVTICESCVGLGVIVRCARTPRPPPICPTIMSDVGTIFAVVLPVGKNDRLFVRLIVKACPVGTVITTGDQPAGMAGVVVVAATAAEALGFNAAQAAVAPTTATPQL